MAIKTEELDQYVKLAAEGDKASFEELYKQTYSTVYFTCLSFLKNEQDAADMTQEVYVTVLGSLSTLEDHGKFLPWLNKIAVNKCKDRLKAAKAVPMDMEEENQPIEENENFLPEEYITNQAKRRIVMDIMKNRLTEAQYQTVIMFYFNEFTAQEISEIMECPIGTVTYRLSAAREKIRQGVSEYENKNHDKLYSYASAVPLLAGVLTAEALSLNVQAAATDAASITNADSTNHAANTSKGGTIKKMLKTPKTIIAATAAAVVIIGGITAAVIATNHENTPSSGTQTRQESQQASFDAESDQESQQTSSGAESGLENHQDSSDTQIDQENPQDSSDTDETVFWLHTADWGEEKDLTGITLFNGECTAPIHLEDFNGHESLTPYGVWYGPNNYAYSDNLTDLIIPEITISDGKNIFFEMNTIVDEEGHLRQLEGYYPTIFQITLPNYSGEEVSLMQAYENNWFYISSGGKYVYEFSDTEIVSMYDNSKTRERLDAIVDKYGRPSYLISTSSFLENYKNNIDSVFYYLVWEKEEFIITVCVRELFMEQRYMIQLDNNSDSFIYYTRELWDDYKEHEYLQEGFVIYELDDLK